MLVIPAIDLKDGHCVRLFQGDMNQDTVYSDDPAATAAKWQSLGAQRLHVVDLNGAFAGHSVNQPAIQSILASLTIPCQLGGGIRTLQNMETWLTLGVTTVILGTIACRQPALVKEACKLFPGHISVGIDARHGRVAVQGWSEVTEILVADLAQRFEDAGVSEIIFTDIQRDGAMTGPNVAATRALAEVITTPVIASGGVSAMADIVHLMDHAGPFANGGCIRGVITGKAIYDGRLDFSQAVAMAGGPTC